ncbi:MAG: class I SAM-dependent methyltransferase [Brevundimonas sp.]|uniref:class I SAM-dependent methyltransferase n=1 Tax=Brevundimonas sp. TaxID=1871086 RepID=UPI00391AB50E
MTAVTPDIAAIAARTPTGFGILLRVLAANWAIGRLTVRLPNGAVHELKGKQTGPAATLIVKDYGFARRVLASGDIGFAEAYMADEWDTPHLAGLLEVLVRNYEGIQRLFDGNVIMRGLHWARHRLNRNSREGARKNIHAHYDLGNAFYETWLDRTMTYSSAVFETPGEALEIAQTRKYARLAQAMDLRAGHKVLEIGCGWGGFAEYAAREVGAHVTGVTISAEQHAYATRRLAQAGLSDQTDIQMIDYRDVQGRFDRVASIEMFEAVGQEYWPTYFDKIHQVLTPGGRAALQIITMDDALFGGYDKRTDFIQKYIFPGGMLPSEAVLQPIVERAGLAWNSVERFGHCYADTLKRWDDRFMSAWDQIQRMGFDDRFRRLWRFYLAYCEAGFRADRINVIQLALARS